MLFVPTNISVPLTSIFPVNVVAPILLLLPLIDKLPLDEIEDVLNAPTVVFPKLFELPFAITLAEKVAVVPVSPPVKVPPANGKCPTCEYV